jgi:undecaprenyl phosphate N,N'-diacetylbacillosamine 1-phosphate transferase
MYEGVIKPVLDRIMAFLGCMIGLLPIIIITIVLRFLHGKGGVFFIQQRPGRHAVVFKLYKFKTMNDKRDTTGKLLSDAERLTGVGKFLRSTSLDELPQLWNVLNGDMSLVGPRPLLIEYLPLYNAEQKRRHLVKPGITGWAQINGRNAIGWKEKFELDVWYVDNLSLLLDLKIIILTVLKVLTREGIFSNGEASAKGFLGD